MKICKSISYHQDVSGDIDISWLFRREIVVDGNFSGDHVRMCTPGDDVRLADGRGYVVETELCWAHIAMSKEE